MKLWLNCQQVAELSGVSEQRIRSICLEITEGKKGKWRDATPVVREVHGRGGRSGTSYEVRADSLPIELQERLKALRKPAETRLNHGKKAQIERGWWHAVISPALGLEKHSRERSAVLKSIADRKHMRPDGSMAQYSVRTLLRRLDAYENGEGLASLGRPKRADAGAARVIVTRAWDAAVPLDDAAKEGVAHDLRQYIRGLVQAGESPSGVVILAAKKLGDLTASAGCTLSQEERERICRVPQQMVQREAVHRKVRRFNSDRKAHEDAKPRIRRSREGLLPMDVVVADVHPVDIYVRREDGSMITPKAIAWLDVATNRVWFDPILLERGDGIRNADVIASFVRMVKEWGVPRSLYLDNGSEYNWAEFIDDALKLLDNQGRRPIETLKPWAERESNLIRAKPYNASAKPIEGLFAILEKTIFSTIAGWVGGDRMNKKTANVGRPVEPFPGSFDDLKRELAAGIAFYDSKSQRGTLQGKSPRQAWEAAIAGGWGINAINANALRVAFSGRTLKTVQQGSITHKGKRYTCRELQGYLEKRVSVLIPKYEDWSHLPLCADDGTVIGFAVPERPYGFLDSAGAIEAEARAKENRNAVRALEKSVPKVDPNAERATYVSAQPPMLAPPVARVIGISPEGEKIAARLGETPDERFKREWREREKIQDEIDEERRARIEAMKSLRLIQGSRQ